MERLQSSNPKHYEKVVKLLNGLAERQHMHVARSLAVSIEAKELAYSSILLTTDPPQGDLSFKLDDATYFGRITLERGRASIYPSRSRW